MLDRKTGSGELAGSGGTLYDHWSADLASTADYYPGGMMMPGRNTEHSWSRMGSQSQQKDDEIYGKGNTYAFKYRMEDARINRFFSPDPLHTKYPHNSDYAFSENRLTDGVELEGLEWSQIKKWSMEAAQTAKWMYKTVSTDVAMYAFPENVSKAFLYHYAHGQGTPLYLTPSDMGKLNVYHISLVGTSPRDMEKFDKMRTGAKVGEAIPLDGYTLDNAAGQAGTLGRFTMVLNGSITFTNKNKSEWTFKGTMRYEDIWDFERNAETDKGGYEGNGWSDAQTEFGKKYLSGTPYKIISYDVPVSQTSNQTVIDYFNGRSQETKSNRITDEKGELDDENR